jgi:hypothetical protein
VSVGINSNAAAAAQNINDAVGMAMLKKASEIQASSALALLNAIPQPQQTSAANLPPHLGQNINTTA